jgi:hypothetical protein
VTVIVGLAASFAHSQNGMTMADMQACIATANRLNEVIIFRSTGPWAKRWIDRGYPTKNFHVKGKSSDWGPQAGFVPYLGMYSKVGHDPVKAQAGTQANDRGISEGYAATAQLELTRLELDTQLNRPEEKPPRTALFDIRRTGSNPRNLHLYARRSGDKKEFVFRAVLDTATHRYKIFVYDEQDTKGNRAKLERATPKPLLVMTSSEAGAMNKPMTGDYDLMSVCPTWRDYMSTSTEEISKEGLDFTGLGVQKGQTFRTGSRMDTVLDMRMNTGAVGGKKTTYQGFRVGAHDVLYRGEERIGHIDEHGDMGNLTPRILRCINALNRAMNPDNPGTAFRRVHHNAESHRHALFGALTKEDMENPKKKDGFPMTGFHPRSLHQARGWAYGDVATLENMDEFRAYANALHAAGFYVPRNWTWGMSIRDKYKNGFFPSH